MSFLCWFLSLPPSWKTISRGEYEMSKGGDSGWLENLVSECAIVQRIFYFRKVIDPIVGRVGMLK